MCLRKSTCINTSDTLHKHFRHIEFHITAILMAEYINLNVGDSFLLFTFKIFFKFGKVTGFTFVGLWGR